MYRTFTFWTLNKYSFQITFFIEDVFGLLEHPYSRIENIPQWEEKNSSQLKRNFTSIYFITFFKISSGSEKIFISGMWCLIKEIILYYFGSFETLVISDSGQFYIHCFGIKYRNF